jgi:hypothetical protein
MGRRERLLRIADFGLRNGNAENNSLNAKIAKDSEVWAESNNGRRNRHQGKGAKNDALTSGG